MTSGIGRTRRSAMTITVIVAIMLAGCTTSPPVVETYPTEAAHWTTVDGVRIHYFEFNPHAPGTPLVLLHGYSGCAYESVCLEGELGNRRVIAPDLPGCGYSEKPDVEYTLELFETFLRDFIDHLGLTEYDLTGHSMGGYIASTFASRYPPGSGGMRTAGSKGARAAGPERLVLLAPYGLNGEAGVILEYLADSGALVDWGLRLNNETILQIALRLNIFHDPERIPEDLVDYLSISTFRTPNAIPALASITRNVIGGEHDEDALRRIETPTLVVWGANDRLLAPRFADEFVERIPDSRLVFVPDCGHMPHVERPDVTGAAIRAFLDEGR